MASLTLNKETQMNWIKPPPRDREHNLRSFLLKIRISGENHGHFFHFFHIIISLLSDVDGG